VKEERAKKEERITSGSLKGKGGGKNLTIVKE